MVTLTGERANWGIWCGRNSDTLPPMRLTNRELLQQLADSDGITTEYPFIEWGYEDALEEFLDEGLVELVAREGDLALVILTQKGRDVLAAATE